MGNCIGFQLSFSYIQAAEKDSLFTWIRDLLTSFGKIALPPVALPCHGLYTSWKQLIYELMPSILWDSLTTANPVLIYIKSIPVR